MSDAEYLRVSGLRKTFGPTVALADISLSLPRGELLALLGPSGCGKTTVLRILAGLLDADGGEVWLDGRSMTGVPAHRRDIGVVFQSYALFPHMTVRGNVRFGLEMRHMPRVEADAQVAAALDLVQLSGMDSRRPAQLSGGQQQRVAVARALAIAPRLLLLDEPLSNLDAMLRAAMRVDLRALHVRTGVTTILVTHDQAEAMTMADRIAVMAQGRIEQIGTPQEIYEDPASLFVASFVGSPAAGTLRVDLLGDGACRVGDQMWHPPLPLARLLSSTGQSEIAISLRPERLRLAPLSAPHVLAASVVAVEFLGADRLVHLRVGTQVLMLRTDTDQPLPPDRIGLMLPDHPPVFDPATGRRIRTDG